jgi:hypothetical protein
MPAADVAAQAARRVARDYRVTAAAVADAMATMRLARDSQADERQEPSAGMLAAEAAARGGA